jgi:hypothetical protein
MKRTTRMASASSTQLLELARENDRLKREIGVLCPRLGHPHRGDGWCYCGGRAVVDEED